MKYRNGATNIGVICGFATSSGDREITVHQTGCREMGFRMRLADGARMPSHEFEPVTVIVRLEPGEAEPTIVALHVTRMARHMAPKTFTWSARKWAMNLDFYPFCRDKAGKLEPSIDAELASEHDLPAWAIEAAEEDDSFAALLAGPSSNKHLQARVLVTGFLRFGGDVAVSRLKDAHDYARILINQPNDTAALVCRLYEGTRGYWSARSMAEAGDRVPVTVTLKPSIDVELEDGQEVVTNSTFCLRMLEVNAVAPEDIQRAA